jgi:hypothetical protein
VIRELDEDAADRMAQALRGARPEPVAAPVAAVAVEAEAARIVEDKLTVLGER